MSNIGGITQNFQTLTPSYAPLGKPVAGLESPENKDQTLPPVEEANASDKNRNQPHQKTDAVSADAENGKRRGGHSADEQDEAADAEVLELAAADPDVYAPQTLHQTGQLQIALQRAAALHSESQKSAVSGGNLVDNFNVAAGHTLAPGTLVDQRS